MKQSIWQKESPLVYRFLVDGEPVALMKLNPSLADQPASLHIGDEIYTIRRTGFWKNSVELSDARQQLVARVYPDKWYAHNSSMDYRGHSWKLVTRNNPLAEFVIRSGEQDLLAYGLEPLDGEVNIRITRANDAIDPLLDGLLWYLFLPVAAENSGDHLTFTMLMSGM